MTINQADGVLARLQRDGAGRDEVDAAREQRDCAVREAVGARARRRFPGASCVEVNVCP